MQCAAGVSFAPSVEMPISSWSVRPLSLAAVLAAAVVVSIQIPGGGVHAQSGCGPTINSIVCENQKPGNLPSEWDVTGAGDLSIQGFATSMSVAQGQTVVFKIDTPASAYSINIYR